MNRADPVISITELRELIARGDCRVVDCRFDLTDPAQGRRLYDESHIDDAVFADLDTDLAGPVSRDSGRHPLPDVAEFCGKLGAWGISNSTHVVAYDHGNGATAGRLWWLLRWLGHTSVWVLDGGFTAWVAAGGSVSAKESTPETADFIGTPDATMVAATDEILSLVESGAPLNLLDARDGPRFRGEMEPIDPVAGRIPGSLHMPFLDDLDADGRWREASELRALWQDALKDRPDVRPIAMCGSGVTACHLIMAADRAGLPLPRLYVGSWSEWIRDPGRPIETGG